MVVCPGCRTWSTGPDGHERIDLRSLERDGEVLACACGRRYPIVDGVPIVLPDASGLLRNELASIVERDLPPEVAALLAAPGPDDAPYPRLLEHLSIYLDAHWGDRATPATDLASLAPVIERLAGLADVEHAVELGCSAGRIVAELARHARHVVGLDLQFAALRRARRLLAGEPLTYLRRQIGRHYTPAVARAGDLAASARFVCADVLDPPLVPGAFDRVVALNVLDSVANPRQLLAVADRLCAPGGELILSSPYAWQSNVMPDEHRLPGVDPAATLRDLLEGYRIEDEDDLPWVLRRDARCSQHYRVHFVRARKL